MLFNGIERNDAEYIVRLLETEISTIRAYIVYAKDDADINESLNEIKYIERLIDNIKSK